MRGKQELIIQTHSMPSGGFLRPARWVLSGFVCVGYLCAVIPMRPLPLLSLLLLTGTYGAWLVIFQLVIFQLEQRRFAFRSRPYWLLALFGLACASQFIPLPTTNPYWLPLLPVITTGLMTTIQPRPLNLGLSCALWLSSHLAFSRLVPHWDVSSQATLLLAFLTTYGYVAIIHRLVMSRAALASTNAELTATHTRLQEYSAQVEELSVIGERNRIAREIHDTLGHALTLLSVQLETAIEFEARDDPRLHEKLLQARQVAKACLTDVRHSVEALRPDEASTGSLQQQLCRLVEEFETTCPHTRITLDLEEITHPLNPDLCLTLYRCAQEALTNIRKHAQATRVLLRLSTSDGEGQQVELTALDNGQRDAPSHEHSASGFGLRGMRERVALLDGRLSAGPESGHGWRVEVVLPLTSQRQTKGSAPGGRQTREEV